MGKQIFVQGLGKIQISGDTPTPEEQDAILRALSLPDAMPEPEPEFFFENQPPAPEPVEPILGIIPEGARRKVRERVEELPGLVQFAVEITPATLGAGAGGAGGSLPGAMVGGLVGEEIGQELGLSPPGVGNLVLSASGPLIGRGVGGGLRLARRAAGKAITGLPFSKFARAQILTEEAAKRFESLGTTILSKTKGLMSRPAGDLYKTARNAGLTIDGADFIYTRRAISRLREELSVASDYPEVRAAMGLLSNVDKSLTGPVSFDTIVLARQLVGGAVSRARNAAGVRLGSAKSVYAALGNDLDGLAARGGLTGRIGKVAQAATQRAKLEFAVRDLEGMVARYIKPIPGKHGSTRIDANGILGELQRITNPKHKRFNKNFTDAIGKENIDEIMSDLSILAKAAEAGSPAGKGSIVQRGITANIGRGIFAGVGGILGFQAGGPLGAGMGGMYGATLPEQLVALLLTKPGRVFLNRAAELGKGQISERAWMMAGEIIAMSTAE